MKNTLLLFFLLLATGAAYAQGGSLVMTPSPANLITVSGVANEFELVAHATLINETSQKLTITWERTANNLFGANWRSLVCDNITCWPPTVSTNTIILNAGQTSILDVHFQSDGATIGPGYGEVTLSVTVAENSAYNLTATYRCDAFTVGVATPYSKELKLYPNPVTDKLNIQFNDQTNIKYVEVYNLIGAKVAEYSVYNAYYPMMIDAATFEPGMYFLYLYDQRRKFVTSKLFTVTR
ncbi:MAG TPA: T9SS type A sorting domain-containing protein [Chitinophagales bacterium]|nr:T9SS type A sorting domain-containing protein [Chitinophagales bacterium]